MESPNRKSSIPIFKQANKSKSFQSFASLNLSDDGKSDSKSNESSVASLSPQPTHNNEPPKLPARPSHLKLHDIESLKEHQHQLIEKYEEALRENMDIQSKNEMLQRDAIEFKINQNRMKDQINDLREKLHKEGSEKVLLQKFNQKLNQDVENLQRQQSEYNNVIDRNKKLQKKFEEILPESFKEFGGENMEDTISKNSPKLPQDLQNLHNTLSELEKLKTYLNNVELQLYEANEKISDLIESNHQLKEEAQTLRTENMELSKISELLQINMEENLVTSKKMEEAFLHLKSQRDDLMIKNRDALDGPTNLTDNEQIRELKTELKRQKSVYEAQFIEYKKIMQEEMSKTSTMEVEELKVRIALLENELDLANQRTEVVEDELRDLKANVRLSIQKMEKIEKSEQMVNDKIPPPPPPMPPPIPNFMSPMYNSHGSTSSLSDAIASQKLNQNLPARLKKQGMATGLDAIINDLKNGTVTLRRRKKLPELKSPKKESELSKVFDLLEKNRIQNRNSRIMSESQLADSFKEHMNMDI